jgi:hypothetical protein
MQLASYQPTQKNVIIIIILDYYSLRRVHIFSLAKSLQIILGICRCPHYFQRKYCSNLQRLLDVTFFVESIFRMLPNTEVICAFVSSIRPATSRICTARNQAGLGTGCIGGIGGGDCSWKKSLEDWSWKGSLAWRNCNDFVVWFSQCCSYTCFWIWWEEFPKVLTRINLTTFRSHEYLEWIVSFLETTHYSFSCF